MSQPVTFLFSSRMPKRIFSKDLLNEVVLQVAKSWQTREGGVLKAILLEQSCHVLSCAANVVAIEAQCARS